MKKYSVSLPRLFLALLLWWVFGFLTAVGLMCPEKAHADPLWDEGGLTTNGKLELAYQAVALADWAQTRTIAANPDQWHENNVVLGEHPSMGAVNTWFAATGIAHAVISHHLSERNARYWQVGTILLESAMVVHNHSIGIRFDF